MNLTPYGKMQMQSRLKKTLKSGAIFCKAVQGSQQGQGYLEYQHIQDMVIYVTPPYGRYCV